MIINEEISIAMVHYWRVSTGSWIDPELINQQGFQSSTARRYKPHFMGSGNITTTELSRNPAGWCPPVMWTLVYNPHEYYSYCISAINHRFNGSYVNPNWTRFTSLGHHLVPWILQDPDPGMNPLPNPWDTINGSQLSDLCLPWHHIISQVSTTVFVDEITISADYVTNYNQYNDHNLDLPITLW